jgi:NTP pyrophosphatase (non-canonical NTP hydrolase)
MNNKQTQIKNIANSWELYTNTTSSKQMLKCVSEVGELADSILKQKADDIVDAFGDVFVTLINTHEMCVREGIIAHSFDECVQKAIDVISSRKGKMVNGAFIKE